MTMNRESLSLRAQRLRVAPKQSAQRSALGLGVSGQAYGLSRNSRPVIKAGGKRKANRAAVCSKLTSSAQSVDPASQ
jgi:hypothetical protein